MKVVVRSTWWALAVGRLMKQISMRSFCEHGEAMFPALRNITNVLISVWIWVWSLNEKLGHLQVTECL